MIRWGKMMRELLGRAPLSLGGGLQEVRVEERQDVGDGSGGDRSEGDESEGDGSEGDGREGDRSAS